MVFRIALCWLLAGQVCAQSRIVSGRVVDARNGEGLAGAYVLAVGNQAVGTSSNAEGYFRLLIPPRVDTPGVDSLKISHLGYQTTRVPATTSFIALTEAPYQLDEVRIRQPNAREIIRRASTAIPQNYGTEPERATGFYREVIRDREAYLSVAEAVFELRSFPQTREALQLRLTQGRAREDVKATRLFEDFHPGGGPLLAAGLDIRLNPPTFLQKTYSDRYNYVLDTVTTLDGRTVYRIRFDQKEGVREALQQGIVFVEAESYAVVRYEAGYSPRGLAYLKHLTASEKLAASLLNISFKRHSLDVTAGYQFDAGHWHLTYATFNSEISYQQPRKNLDALVTIAGELMLTERSREQVQPLAKSDRWHAKDLPINLSTEYNEAFWGPYNILAPTQSVRDIVASLHTGDEQSQSLSGSGWAASGWRLYQGQLAKTYQQGEDLFLKPLMKCGWQDEATGPALYRTRTGDFTLEAQVQVTKATDSTSAPDRGFQAGGLLIRDTTREAENHLFLGIGTGGNDNLKILVENTVSSNTATNPTKVPTANYALRVQRRGDTYTLSVRGPEATDWQVVKTIVRTDFAAGLQVGLAAYAHFPGNGPKMRPDLRVRFRQPSVQQP